MSKARSQAALRGLFEWIEARYGGVPFSKAKVLRTNDLPSALPKLFRHEVTAIHVPGFYPSDAASQLGLQLSKEPRQNWKVSTSRGLESSDVSTVGAHPPFNAAESVETYFEKVQEELRNRRMSESGSPQLWPLDLLRLKLDEAWTKGCGLARDSQSRLFGGGLARIIRGPTRWKRGYIHADELGPLNSQQGLFSANIYLQLPIPETLYIWPTDIRSRWDWYRNAILLSGLSTQDAASQVRLRQVLGEPQTICAEPGDLILLCVQRPHAACGLEMEGTRVSLQCFLQHKGVGERILIDC